VIKIVYAATSLPVGATNVCRSFEVFIMNVIFCIDVKISVCDVIFCINVKNRGMYHCTICCISVTQMVVELSFLGTCNNCIFASFCDISALVILLF
jgi:hypothetical protein